MRQNTKANWITWAILAFIAAVSFLIVRIALEDPTGWISFSAVYACDEQGSPKLEWRRGERLIYCREGVMKKAYPRQVYGTLYNDDLKINFMTVPVTAGANQVLGPFHLRFAGVVLDKDLPLGNYSWRSTVEVYTSQLRNPVMVDYPPVHFRIVK